MLQRANTPVNVLNTALKKKAVARRLRKTIKIVKRRLKFGLLFIIRNDIIRV